jgi:cytochrome c-type biogenesis protein CcmF
VLTAFAQYLKYKDTPTKMFFKKILVPTLVSLVIAVLVIWFGDFNYDSKGPMFKGAIWLAVACSIYTIIANASYIWLGLKGKLRLSGGSVSHVGFGLILLGILISSSKKETISRNTSGIFVPFDKDSGEKAGENLTLVKGIRNDMGKYWATYESDSAHPKKQQWYYSIRFQRKDGKEEFVLKPNAFVNYKGNEGLMSKPDSRHYWDHDVFTYVTSLPDPAKQANDTANFQKNVLKKGDSLFYSKGYVIVEDVRLKDSLPVELFGNNGFLYETPLRIIAQTGSVYTVTPRLAFAKGEYVMVPDTITAESLVLQLQQVNADQTIELGVKESDSVMKYVTLKAYKFPFINMLWLGVIITAVGVFMSMFRRIQMNRKTAA